MSDDVKQALIKGEELCESAVERLGRAAPTGDELGDLARGHLRVAVAHLRAARRALGDAVPRSCPPVS